MDCDIIIPVGPGHEQMALGAAASFEMAKVCGMGAFDKISPQMVDDTQGRFGRSAARNSAAAESTAEWLFFLDADDVVLPEVFQAAVPYMDRDAVWGKFAQLDGTCVLDRFQGWGFETYDELIQLHPWCSVKIGHLVRRKVFNQYKFNEDLDCGEDWDYYLRVWKHQRCIKHGALTYAKRSGAHSTGPRSATGKQWNETVNAMLERARGEQ